MAKPVSRGMVLCLAVTIGLFSPRIFVRAIGTEVNANINIMAKDASGLQKGVRKPNEAPEGFLRVDDLTELPLPKQSMLTNFRRTVRSKSNANTHHIPRNRFAEDNDADDFTDQNALEPTLRAQTSIPQNTNPNRLQKVAMSALNTNRQINALKKKLDQQNVVTATHHAYDDFNPLDFPYFVPIKNQQPPGVQDGQSKGHVHGAEHSHKSDEAKERVIGATVLHEGTIAFDAMNADLHPIADEFDQDVGADSEFDHEEEAQLGDFTAGTEIIQPDAIPKSSKFQKPAGFDTAELDMSTVYSQSRSSSNAQDVPDVQDVHNDNTDAEIMADLDISTFQSRHPMHDFKKVMKPVKKGFRSLYKNHVNLPPARQLHQQDDLQLDEQDEVAPRPRLFQDSDLQDQIQDDVRFQPRLYQEPDEQQFVMQNEPMFEVQGQDFDINMQDQGFNMQDQDFQQQFEPTEELAFEQSGYFMPQYGAQNYQIAGDQDDDLVEQEESLPFFHQGQQFDEGQDEDGRALRLNNKFAILSDVAAGVGTSLYSTHLFLFSFV